MRALTVEDIKAMHRLLAEKTGGGLGLRDEGLLSGALAPIFSSFGGEEFYPTIEEKAARLAYSLISCHAFLDGNKRVGLLAMLTFLAINGSPVSPSSEELVRVGLAAASGEMGYEALLGFVRRLCGGIS